MGLKRFFTLRHRAVTCARGTRQWVHLAFNMQKKQYSGGRSRVWLQEWRFKHCPGVLALCQEGQNSPTVDACKGMSEEQDVFKGCVHVALGDMI